MIDHPFKPHEVWKTRDQCEHRLDEEKDGAYGICAAPRSEHMDEVHVLKVQLATALRERDEQKARADAAEAELASLRAEFKSTILFHNGRVTEHESALAAARRECEGLRALLSDCGEVIDAHMGPSYELLLNRIDSALAAPAAAPEKPYPEPRCTCHARHDGKHAQACELWNTTGDL